MPAAVDGVAVGALLACAVERAERGTTVRRRRRGRGEIAMRWEGEDLPDPVARRAVEEPWSGSAASLAPHLARRRLAAGRRGAAHRPARARGRRARRGAAERRSTQNVEPSPSTLLNADARRRARARARGSAPGRCRCRRCGGWPGGRRGRSARTAAPAGRSGMPSPRRAPRSARCRCPPSRRGRTAPPSGEYLMALESRLPMTCPRRRRSTWTTSGPSATSTRWSGCSARRAKSAACSRSSSPTSTGSG